MFSYRQRALVSAATFAAATLFLAACSTDTNGQVDASDATATVIATTTQIGSVAEQVTDCAGGQTTILMSAGDDPHQFEASSAQIVDMINADLVLTNGLGLESSMQRAIENAVTDGAELFEVAPQLDPIPLTGGHHDHGEHEHAVDDGHDHGGYDAHIWMDVSRMADGAELIGEKIAKVTGDDTYVACGSDVASELQTVDSQMQDLLNELESARLVTDHAAYGYFADRYGLEISGVVIPGGSTDGEPSSQELSQLTALLNDEGADALVTSKANTNRMITALAEETGGEIPVVELHESAIGEPGSGAESYQDAMLHNAQALAEALN